MHNNLEPPPQHFRALAATCMLYNRTEHSQGFFINFVKSSIKLNLTLCTYKYQEKSKM